MRLRAGGDASPRRPRCHAMRETAILLHAAPCTGPKAGFGVCAILRAPLAAGNPSRVATVANTGIGMSRLLVATPGMASEAGGGGAVVRLAPNAARDLPCCALGVCRARH
jgi:hypothetical protein